MSKYIDADLLRKEINRWKKAMADAVGEYSDGVMFALKHFTFIFDSLQQEQDLIIINKKDWEAQEQFRKNKDFGKPLQQEQQEVDLEEKMDRFFDEMPIQEHENIFEDTYQMIARHFYELGLKAREEQMMKDAVEGYVNYYEGSGGILMAEAQVGCPYHNGDKVKIIIVKEEKK